MDYRNHYICISYTHAVLYFLINNSWTEQKVISFVENKIFSPEITP
jgi:hypothetical protein